MYFWNSWSFVSCLLCSVTASVWSAANFPEAQKKLTNFQAALLVRWIHLQRLQHTGFGNHIRRLCVYCFIAFILQLGFSVCLIWDLTCNSQAIKHTKCSRDTFPFWTNFTQHQCSCPKLACLLATLKAQAFLPLLTFDWILWTWWADSVNLSGYAAFYTAVHPDWLATEM